MMKIMITGGSGFLGSALARHFSDRGDSVFLLLRLDSELHRLRGYESKLHVERYSTDSDIKTIVIRVQPDIIIHTACSYGRNGENTLHIIDANIRLGIAVIESLLDVSHSVTFINTGTILDPEISAYALSKHQFSEWGRLIALQSGGHLRFINVLLQHMYGPGDDISKFPAYVLYTCWQNKAELNLTPGDQKRDFIYIDDVVNAYETLVNRYNELDLVHDIEVGSGEAPTVRNFVEVVHRLTGSSTSLRFGALPYRENETMHCEADISVIKSLGWKPFYSLENGIKETIKKEFH